MRLINKRTNLLTSGGILQKSFLERFVATRATICSSLDIKAAFHSIAITPESRQYFGISSYSGAKGLTYARTPMGHCNSPPLLKEIMTFVLNDLKPENRDSVLINYDDLFLFKQIMSYLAFIRSRNGMA